MDSEDRNCSGSPPPALLQETRAEEEAPEKICKNASDAGANYFGWSSEDDFLFTPSPATRPPIILSSRSLELCTEIPGSETGTSCYPVFDENIPSSPSSLTNPRRNPYRLRKLEKKPRKKDFPPLLTTMVGQDRIRLKPQREEGRLVLKAVAVPIPPPPRTNFSQGSRRSESDGHLRL